MKIGYFWFESESPVQGAIEYDSIGNGKLMLLSLPTKAVPLSFVYSSLFGHLNDGQSITIPNAIYSQQKMGSNNLISHEFRFESIIENMTGVSISEKHTTKVRIAFTGLIDWAKNSGFSLEIRSENSVDVSYKKSNDKVFECKNFNVVISTDAAFSFDGTNHSRNEYSFLELHYNNPVLIESARKDCMIIFKLFEFLIDRPANIQSIDFLDPLKESNPDGLDRYAHLKARHHFRIVETPIPGYHEMWLLLSDVESSLSVMIDNWFDFMNNNDDIYDLYYQVLTKDMKYGYRIIWNLTQCIEGLHRRLIKKPKYLTPEEFKTISDKLYAVLDDCLPVDATCLAPFKGKISFMNEMTLRSRLETIMNDFHWLNLLDDEMLQAAVRTRDYTTHFDEKLKSKKIEHSEIPKIAKGLYAMFQTMVLNQISDCPANCRKFSEVTRINGMSGFLFY